MRTSLFGLLLIAMSTFMYACNGGEQRESSVNTVNWRMSVTYERKVTIHPANGDIVKWPSNVRFVDRSPCEGDDDVPVYETNECKVIVAAGTRFGAYRYICPDNSCADPEIVVGTDENRDFMPLAVSPALQSALSVESAPRYIDFTCRGTTINPIPMLRDGVQVGRTVRWYPNGGKDQYPEAWTVTWSGMAPTCSEMMPINQGQRDCTIAAGTPATTYNYTITSTMPACSGTGMVVVTP